MLYEVITGEREMASGNKSLGRFDLAGIPPAPRGMPQSEVTFDIDANGILHVHAKDKATGKEKVEAMEEALLRLAKEKIPEFVKEHEAEKQTRVEERTAEWP